VSHYFAVAVGIERIQEVEVEGSAVTRMLLEANCFAESVGRQLVLAGEGIAVYC